jgi:hypothetical protein
MKKNRYVLLGVGSFSVTLVLLLTVFFPIFSKQTGLEDVDDSFVDDVLPPNLFIKDDTVYADDEQIYFSATPHTLNGGGDVVFEFESKQYDGDVDLCWGFNGTAMKPIEVWLWENYSHPHAIFGFEEDWGYITLNNVSSFIDLGIGSYDNYSVYLGTRNNTHLFNISYQVFDDFDEIINVNGIFAFTNYSVSGDDYTLCGYYDKDVKIWDNQTFWDWRPWDIDYNHIDYNYRNMTDWYIISGQTIQKDVRYKCKVHIEQQTIKLGLNEGGEYWFAFKPSSETLGQAINNGHLYYLDPWYDSSNYPYRKYVSVSPKRDNYQTMITVDQDSGGSVDCEGNCNDNFSDLRFADSDGNLCPYWIENYVSGDWATVWVNNTGNDSVLYMYYGYSSAAPYSTTSTWDTWYDWTSDHTADYGTVKSGSGTPSKEKTYVTALSRSFSVSTGIRILEKSARSTTTISSNTMAAIMIRLGIIRVLILVGIIRIIMLVLLVKMVVLNQVILIFLIFQLLIFIMFMNCLVLQVG